MKWVAAVASLLLVSAWGASGWFSFSAGCSHADRFYGASISAGTLTLSSNSTTWLDATRKLANEGTPAEREVAARILQRHAPWYRTHLTLTKRNIGPDSTLFEWSNLSARGSQRTTLLHVSVPLWMVLATVGAATALFWWRDRPAPPGVCQVCAYDLTGNTSGRCPECGAQIDPVRMHARQRPSENTAGE